VNFENKHVFIITDIDKFFYLNADAYINKVGISADRLCAVVLQTGSVDRFNELQFVEGVMYERFSEDVYAHVFKADTITSMSLMSYNSWFVHKLIEMNSSILDKLYLFLTDDEVDRWRIIFAKHGKLVPDLQLYFTDHDIAVLSVIKNVIAVPSTFKPLLKDIFKHEVNYVDVGCVFDILPSYESSLLKKILPNSSLQGAFKILWGSKGVTRRSFHELLQFMWYVKVKNTEINVFTRNPFQVIAVSIVRAIINVVSKKGLTVICLNHMDPLSYCSMVMSCNYFVLQDRGGASTAQLYLKWGRGIVCIRQKSHNSEYFKSGLRVNFIEYNTVKDLWNDIVTNKISIKENSEQLYSLENQWMPRYKDLFI